MATIGASAGDVVEAEVVDEMALVGAVFASALVVVGSVMAGTVDRGVNL